jgi:hypothetical protein
MLRASSKQSATRFGDRPRRTRLVPAGSRPARTRAHAAVWLTLAGNLLPVLILRASLDAFDPCPAGAPPPRSFSPPPTSRVSPRRHFRRTSCTSSPRSACGSLLMLASRLERVASRPSPAALPLHVLPPASRFSSTDIASPMADLTGNPAAGGSGATAIRGRAEHVILHDRAHPAP